MKWPNLVGWLCDLQRLHFGHQEIALLQYVNPKSKGHCISRNFHLC
jgi:hypothetical protein